MKTEGREVVLGIARAGRVLGAALRLYSLQHGLRVHPYIQLIAVGIAARLLTLLLFDPLAVLWLGDTLTYVNEARSLQQGEVPASQRSLGYPLFLAGALWLGPVGAILLQCVISLGVAVATWHLLGRARLAFWTALLFASSPFLALADLHLKSESLFINMLWLGFLLLHRKEWIWSGIVLGLAILTRDTLMLLPLAILPLALKDRRFAITAAIAAHALAPMLFAHGPSRFGLSLWIGTWERNEDWYLGGLDAPDFPAYAFVLPGERAAVEAAWRKNERGERDDGTLRDLALRRITADPAGTALAWARRYPQMWLGTRTEAQPMRFKTSSVAWLIAKSAFYGLNLLTLALGFWGLVRRGGLFALPVAYIALIYVPFHNSETRYSLPALPFFYFCTAALATQPSPSPRTAL